MTDGLEQFYEKKGGKEYVCYRYAKLLEKLYSQDWSDEEKQHICSSMDYDKDKYILMGGHPFDLPDKDNYQDYLEKIAKTAQFD